MLTVRYGSLVTPCVVLHDRMRFECEHSIGRVPWDYLRHAVWHCRNRNGHGLQVRDGLVTQDTIKMLSGLNRELTTKCMVPRDASKSRMRSSGKLCSLKTLAYT